MCPNGCGGSSPPFGTSCSIKPLEYTAAHETDRGARGISPQAAMDFEAAEAKDLVHWRCSRRLPFVGRLPRLDGVNEIARRQRGVADTPAPHWRDSVRRADGRPQRIVRNCSSLLMEFKKTPVRALARSLLCDRSGRPLSDNGKPPARVGRKASGQARNA